MNAQTCGNSPEQLQSYMAALSRPPSTSASHAIFELIHTWDDGKKTQAHAAMPCHVVCLPAACGVSAWRAPGHTRQVGDVARPPP